MTNDTQRSTLTLGAMDGIVAGAIASAIWTMAVACPPEVQLAGIGQHGMWLPHGPSCPLGCEVAGGASDAIAGVI